MTAVIANVTDREVLVFDEFYREHSNTHELAEYLRKTFGKCKIIPDATGKALKTSAAGVSDHEILRRAGHWVESSSNPFRMDRYNATNQLFESERLWIDPKCVKLIKDLEQLAYKEGTNLPDLANKMLGHVSDSLGYLVFKTHRIAPQVRSRAIHY